eukprot:1152041-Pelagomonas_calceolata.AAC.1
MLITLGDLDAKKAGGVPCYRGMGAIGGGFAVVRARCSAVAGGAGPSRARLVACFNQNERVLVRPIKPSDIEKLHCALNDPSYTPHTTHASILETLNSMHNAALSHLSAIESSCATKPARLRHLNGLPAREGVENIADKIVNLIKERHEVALQVCTTKVKPTTSKHFRTRRVSNLRKSLCNKLKSVRHVQYNLPQAHLALTFTEVLALHSHNPNLHRAILFVQNFSLPKIASSAPDSNSAPPPLPPLETVQSPT